MSPMWSAQRTPIPGRTGEIITLVAEHALTVSEVIDGWRDDDAFRTFFITELAASPYPAFFWEMPPLMRNTAQDRFECAVIANDALARMCADDTDFVAHLSRTTEHVVAFPNLGRDALLIAPRKISDADCYGHIAAFVRSAPEDQQHVLFQRLAAETEKMVQAGRRFWISTSGLGVPWVHVRVDSYPKYYQHRPYKEQ